MLPAYFGGDRGGGNQVNAVSVRPEGRPIADCGGTFTMTLVEALGWLGAALAILGSAMRTIVPLRVIGITTNAVGLICALAALNYPGMLVNVILLPLNSTRLVQMLRLVKKVELAASSDLSMEWLKPFMTRRRARKGEILFAKGNAAECMFYTVTGRYRLRELGLEVAQGCVVGEMGFLAPDHRRTQTLECIEAGEMLTISYEELRQLYFQNPEFGFYFLRLTSQRLFQNMDRMEQELIEARAAQSSAARIGRAA
jgi:CRP/FNR family transcriptional regulator, cyclic AMP receptor protein